HSDVHTLGVVMHSVPAHERTLRPRTLVQRESRSIVQVTVLDEHLVGNAPDNAVAIKIAHRHFAYRDVIRFIQANAAVVERALVEWSLLPSIAMFSMRTSAALVHWSSEKLVAICGSPSR